MTHEQLLAALATIGTDEPFPDHLFPVARPPMKVSAPKWERAPYQGRTRIDHEGVWDELPPDQEPRSGDHLDGDDVWWRPRPTVRANTTPKDKYENSVELRVKARKKVEELAATLPEDHPDVIRARDILHRCHRSSMALLAELEKWQEDGLDPELTKSVFVELDVSSPEGRKAVDKHRKTPIGRKKRNDVRRKVRSTPNADLSGATEAEKAEHKRRQAADRQRAKRARDNAAKKAAATGDLSAAIS